MKRPRLKVFQARFGFHDSVVAAVSQAAALRAWGVHQNLFADGQASITNDPRAVEAARVAGMRAVLVLTSETEHPLLQGNFLLDRLLGAEAHFIPPNSDPLIGMGEQEAAKIEELMFHLKDSCTMAIVTHNMQQAARASDFTAFMLDGRLIEHSETSKLFTTPTDPRTEAYITGRFG